MGYMREYITKSVTELQTDLNSLIGQFNKKRETFLLVYASDIGKQIPDISMSKDDYYTIFDMLNKIDSKNIDVFIETPGGSGDAAEDIAKFLHEKFEKVSFIISGEAKSAGTILTLSGNEILMTKTGSLGPIDAQIRIGRSTISAYDYVQWIKEKKAEASKNGELNPVDATMIAQISPGEMCNVYHALKFAEDLVIDWLPKYKFADWNITETEGNIVTEDTKTERAKEIAQKLTNHADWRSHGRSIKIDDLEKNVKIKITKVDDDDDLSEIIYRIHTVIRMIFAKSSVYKIFSTEHENFRKNATPKENVNKKIPAELNAADVVQLDVVCPQCGIKHSIYAKFVNNPKIDTDFQGKGTMPFPKDNILKCQCGYEIDVSGIKNDIESQSGRKMLT